VNAPLNMPPNSSTGVISAHALSLKARQTSANPSKLWRGNPWRGAMIATIIISDTPIRMPGITPARNSRPIDASALTP